MGRASSGYMGRAGPVYARIPPLLLFPAKFHLTFQNSTSCISLNQGVHPLAKVKFKDFSRTFKVLFSVHSRT